MSTLRVIGTPRTAELIEAALTFLVSSLMVAVVAGSFYAWL